MFNNYRRNLYIKRYNRYLKELSPIREDVAISLVHSFIRADGVRNLFPFLDWTYIWEQLFTGVSFEKSS